MSNLFSPDTLHVAFAVAGAVFGYWLKRHPNVVPPELQPVVDLLLLRHAAAQQSDAHDKLQTLAQPAPAVVALAVDKSAITPAAEVKKA